MMGLIGTTKPLQRRQRMVLKWLPSSVGLEHLLHWHSKYLLSYKNSGLVNSLVVLDCKLKLIRDVAD